MPNQYIDPTIGQGPAVPADALELERDAVGFTNPNLHRRIDPQPPTDAYEVAPRDYMLGIYDVYSYRTTQINTHDEESTTSEVP